jgi:hypothetical protein
MLISKETAKDLDVLYGQFFNLNSLFDRAVSVMLNDWAMVKASNIIHHNLAHLFPLMADMVSEIKDNFDESSVRPTVDEHIEVYKDLAEMFDRLLDECAATYDMIKIVDKGAIERGDLNVHAELMGLVRSFNKVIGQILTLQNKAHQIQSFDTFDAHIEEWGIVGLGE